MHLTGTNPGTDVYATGFFTAGHCVATLAPDQIWYQGPQQQDFGVYANNSLRKGTSSDAGSLVTNNTSTITYRDSSNLVAIRDGVPPLRITSRIAVNSGKRGPIELSGAITGEDFGVQTNSGIGSTRIVVYGNQRQVVQHEYTATMDLPVQRGDSGAPVYQGPFFNGTGIALGTSCPDGTSKTTGSSTSRRSSGPKGTSAGPPTRARPDPARSPTGRAQAHRWLSRAGPLRTIRDLETNLLDHKGS